MIDVHAHVLPGIDHGSSSVEESLFMLRQLERHGVEDVFCTSHYYASDEQVQQFLAEYEQAFNTLSAENDTGVRLHRGAEVTISRYFHYHRPDSRLCLDGGRRMLVELPFTREVEPWVFECLSSLIDKYGIIPVIAHPERYYYVAKHPGVLRDFHSLGAEFQVNASSVKKREQKRALRYMLKHDFINYVASDLHFRDDSCMIDEGIALLGKKNADLRQQLCRNGQALLREI